MNNEDKLMADIFKKPKTIGIVGMSRDPEKAAGSIPQYLLNQGYNVIPINPNAYEILGKKSYSNLKDVPDKIDIINVFRPSEDVFEIVSDAIERKKQKGDISVIWLQSGIYSDEARKIAEEKGIIFIQDMCIYVLHRRIDYLLKNIN